MNGSQSLLLRSLERLKPRERLWPDEWADRYRVVFLSAFPGKWRTELTPYLRGILRAFADPGIRRVIAMTGTQVGKTEAKITLLIWILDERPCAIIDAWPTEDDCNRHKNERVVPALAATAAELGWDFNERTDGTGPRLHANGQVVFFAWAQTPRSLKGVPCPVVLKDEIDEWPEGHSELADSRCKAAIDAKIWESSSPTLEGHGIHRAYSQSDRRTYWVPCPHCGHYHTLIWGNVHWGVTDADGTRRTGSQCTEEEVEQSAHLVCPGCGDQIFDHHKPGMLSGGVWCREGERPERKGQRGEGSEGQREETSGVDAPLSLCPSAPSRTHLNVPLPSGVTIIGSPVNPGREAGFHLSSLYSPFPACTIGSIARKFAKAGFRMTPEFVNDELGEAWQDKGEKVEEDFLRERCVPVSAGGYRFGTVPAWATLLIGFIDVQQHVVHCTVRAFAPRAERSALVWFATLPAPESEKLAEIDAIVPRTFEREGGGVARVLMWGIDSGHRTKDVYDLARRHQSAFDRLIVTKGQDESKRPDPWWPQTNETTKGKRLPVPLMHINVGFFKDEVFGAMQTEAWALPAGCPAEYLEQVTAEQRLPITTSVSAGTRGARFEKPGSRTRWVMRKGRKDNHAFDCEVGIAALAFRWNARGCEANLLGTAARPVPLPAELRSQKQAHNRDTESTEKAPSRPAAPGPNTPRAGRPWRSPGGWMRRRR